MIAYDELGGDGQLYPLFLISTSCPVSEVGQPLQSAQERALVLLNRDIQYLNMLAGQSQVIGATFADGPQSADQGLAASSLLMLQ